VIVENFYVCSGYSYSLSYAEFGYNIGDMFESLRVSVDGSGSGEGSYFGNGNGAGEDYCFDGNGISPKY
jgi:hypothetical protein